MNIMGFITRRVTPEFYLHNTAMNELSAAQLLLIVNGYVFLAFLLFGMSARGIVCRVWDGKWCKKKLRFFRFLIAIIPMISCLAILAMGLFALGMSHGSRPENYQVALFILGCLGPFFLLVVWCFGVLLTDLLWAAAMVMVLIYFSLINPALYIRCWANSNFAWAQLWLVEQYQQGTGGLKQSDSMARVWTEKAALNGSAEAQYEFAKIQKRSKKARTFFLMAAEQGHAEAMIHLVRLTRDKSERQHWLNSALVLGHPEAFYISAREEMSRNLPSARELMTEAAEKGSRSAMVYLISEYQTGGVLFDQDRLLVQKWTAILDDTPEAESDPDYLTEIWIDQKRVVIDQNRAKADRAEDLFKRAKTFLRHPAKDDVLHERALRYLRSAAEAGSGEAALRLANIITQETGAAVLPPEALHWYEIAAENDSARALKELTMFFKDKPEATVEDLKRSERYNTQLLDILGQQKLKGSTRLQIQNWSGELRDTQKDIQQLNTLGGSWQEAARLAKEDPEKEYLLAQELIASRQYEKGMERMRSAAARGNPDARFKQAVQTLNGPRSFTQEIEAAHEFQELDRQGYLPASFRLGMLYQSNTGLVPKNLYLARELYKKVLADESLREKAERRLKNGFQIIERLAIEEGDDSLQKIEAWYAAVSGAEQEHDPVLAEHQYKVYKNHFRNYDELRRLAEAGDDHAQYELAQTLQSQNLSEAMQWLKRSAENDNSDAEYELAVRMIRGKKNSPETVLELQRHALGAAEKGHVGAMAFVAAQYRSGRGGFKQDSVLAEKYYSQALAATEGDTLYRGEVAGKAIIIKRSSVERLIEAR